MGAATLLDTAIIVPAAVLGLIGLWLGFVRSTVAWPMRWLIPLLGAYAAGRLAEFGLLIAWEMTGLLYLVGPPVGWAALLVTFVATLVPLLMFMDNLISRVAVWTAGRRVGLGERALGGLFGIACALLVAGIAIEHSPIRRPTADEPAWASGSALLPYFRSASETVENALASAWPYALGMRRWRR